MAAGQYDAFVTVDAGIEHQQNLGSLSIAVVALRARSNRIEDPRPLMPRLRQLAMVDPRILRVRGIQVLVDADLAEIYGVSTKALNHAVKRNAERFPEDFRFQLTAAEREEVVTNCDHITLLTSTSFPAR